MLTADDVKWTKGDGKSSPLPSFMYILIFFISPHKMISGIPLSYIIIENIWECELISKTTQGWDKLKTEIYLCEQQIQQDDQTHLKKVR